MGFFMLKEGVYFVRGSVHGALLDTNTGNVYSINKKGTAIITGEVANDDFWRKLVEIGVAEQSDCHTPLPSLPRLSQAELDFIWFEIITSDCNESCVHCYADSRPPSHKRVRGLSSDVDFQDSKRKLLFEDWCELIKEGFELGCRQCQFIGGEPFLYRDRKWTVLDLAEYARKVGYEMVEIFTNATLLTKKKVSRIKQLGLRVAVSIYSDDAVVHDSITRTPGSHSRTMRSLQMLKDADVPTRVGFVVMRQNEHTVSTTIQLIENLDFPGSSPDPLRPKGRGQNIALLPSPSTTIKYGVLTTADFSVTRELLQHYTSMHSCLAGKIAITETGDVLPCIFSRDQVIGNVKVQGGIGSIISTSQMQKLWLTTKDDVLVCRDCEYRYVCFDCRPLSDAAALGKGEFISAPYPRCSYNPYTGKWGKGLWKMTQDGPCYDTSYENIMNEVIVDDNASVAPQVH
ncbi:MAG: hypothetical protein BroJett021_51420 [Chloroflexota bacterium]|nr:radical SAM protein [Caldilinea sp.]GIK76154.1 MAG: hypothetical protein BroJett021_51420 [Chloroflexota bacterium]